MKKIFLVMLILLSSCAHGQKIVRLACPNYPIMLRVEVRDGAIKGKDLDHAIENHQSLWGHIHLLEKLGCKSP